jgi:hypothetical protein
MDRRLRTAAIVTGGGLGLHLFAALHWTPATFILSATIGLPLVVLGAGLFLRAVWRLLKERGAV